MPYIVTCRYDPDDLHPFASFATPEGAEAWCIRMARESGGSSADLLILGPGDTVPLSMPLSCHCDEGDGWGVRH